MNAKICEGGSERSPSQVVEGQQHGVNNPVCQQELTSERYPNLWLFTVKRDSKVFDSDNIVAFVRPWQVAVVTHSQMFIPVRAKVKGSLASFFKTSIANSCTCISSIF